MSDDAIPVAIVGLGNMGMPMASRLIDAGYSVRGFDLNDTARIRLTEAGGAALDSAAAATSDAQTVILMLPDSAAVSAVVDELLDAGALAKDTLVIDMSSSEPLATRTLYERLAHSDVRLVDAPVSGGVRGAEQATLTVMVGGDVADVSRAAPLLATFGRVVECGPIGAGHALKALNNLLSATHLWVTSEVIEAGKRFGLDPQVMLSVFNGSSGKSGSTENKWPNFILPGSFNSGFGLRLMVKDIMIGTSLGRAVGAPIALGEDAVELWRRAGQDLAPDADHTQIATWIANHTGS